MAVILLQLITSFFELKWNKSVKIRTLLVMMIFDDLYVLAVWKSQRSLSKCAWEDPSYFCRPQSEWLCHQQGGHAGASFPHKHHLPLCHDHALWWPPQVQSRSPFMTCIKCVCVHTYACFFIISIFKKRYSQWKQSSKPFPESCHPQITI